MDLYPKAEKFVLETWEKVNNPNDIRHAQRTVYWILQLKQEADEALLIAGVAHDIERAIYGDWKKGSSDPEALQKHQALSAEEIEKFLLAEDAGAELIARVKSLIEHHEEGGDEDQNVLCDADALSFFEDKALRGVRRRKANGMPKEEIRKNMDYYFSRFVSQRAREIAQLWYLAAIEEIDK
ncbi:DUF4202 family protein [Patescibacteria group bacterium]|nr:MAG: DUF4202 family protein [Patescibacteria group bacterium]